MFQGSIVALVTPMKKAGEIDIERLRQLIEFHIDAGTKAIVLNGTTGEAPTLTYEERLKVIKVGVEQAKKRIPIIAGTGTYSTAETITQSLAAKALGAEACLIVTPYYNKPTQEGLYQHYSAIAEALNLPIILYNVKARTACELMPETIGRLVEKYPNIIGIKEGDNDLKRGPAILKACSRSFSLFSGDDASSLAFMLQGGHGVISVTANVAPKLMNEMCTAALQSNIRLAGEINTRLMPLHKALFLETNPIPVKWALAKMGLISEGIRLPLTPLSEAHQNDLKEAMKNCGVIK